ncbi:MAG: undecaprenyl-diphosphate phosphatase [Myxococcota bacterium]|nr:undecaprenyl-diphosphate phosphatase [Myxococcota bacterium]
MSTLEALILGLVQGLTEFLPVSSSGHLVLGEALLGAHSTGIGFEVVLHGATLLAVLIFYRRRIAELVAGVLRLERASLEYGGKLALATLPAVGVGLFAKDWVEAQFDRPVVAGVCLLVTGVLLWTTRHTLPRADRPEPGWAAAWWIGCAQAVAILPGISRSGATVVAALALRVAPLKAAEFSFLMSVAAIGGALVLLLPDLAAEGAAGAGPLLAGAAMALVSGVAALALFVRLLRARSFHQFAFYVWVVGALAIALTL